MENYFRRSSRSIKVKYGLPPSSLVISTLKNVMKIIEFYLTPSDNKTRIVAITTIHTSYWSLSIIGHILLILVGVMTM